MSETDKMLVDLERKGIQTSLLKYQVEVYPEQMIVPLDDSENFRVVVTMFRGKDSLQMHFPVSATMMVEPEIKFELLRDLLIHGILKQVGHTIDELEKNFTIKVAEKKKEESL